MDEIRADQLPEALSGLRVSNWRVWQYLEAITSIAKGRSICLNCGHLTRRHSIGANNCMDCDEISRNLYILPEHAINSSWVGFQECPGFAPFDPIIHSGLRLRGYALTLEEQKKRNKERARMPLSAW